MKRKLALCAILALIAVLATGCSAGREAAAPEEQTADASGAPADAPEAETSAVKTSFTAEDFQADYAQFWDILEKNYPFFPLLEQNGTSAAGLRETYEARLARVTDAAGFAMLLQMICAQLQNFAHLGVVSVDTFDLYQDLADTAADDLSPWLEAVSGAQTQQSYAQLRASAAFGAGAQTADAAVKSADYPQVQAYYDEAIQAAYFHFFTFDHQTVERDAGFVAAFLQAVDGEVAHIILDITGNSGGDTAYWVQNIAAPFGGQYTWDYRIFFQDSPLNRSFFIESGEFSPQPVSTLSDAQNLPLEADWVEPVCIQFDFDAEPGEKVPAQAKQAARWLLVDGSVYSSSDNFAAFCKATGWATVVGTTTGGDGDGIAPVFAVLDQTGLLVQFSTTFSCMSDGSYSFAGTVPDYVSQDTESPMQTCLRLIGRSGAE